MWNIGSPSHFRGVWACPAPRREALRGRTTLRLPWNDWGKVLLACTCVTSHTTLKKSGYGLNPYPLGLFDLRHPYPLSLKRPGSIWAAGGLISQSAFVIPSQPPLDMREIHFPPNFPFNLAIGIMRLPVVGYLGHHKVSNWISPLISHWCKGGYM